MNNIKEAIKACRGLLSQIKEDLDAEYKREKPNKATIRNLMQEKVKTLALLHELEGKTVRLVSVANKPQPIKVITSKPILNPVWEDMKRKA